MGKGVHNYQKRIEGAKRLISDSKEISEKNKSIIFDFEKDCFANGLSPGRVVRYLWDLKTIAIKWLKTDFEKATKNDIKAVVAGIEMSEYAPRTKRDFKIALRQLYKFIRGTEEAPEEVRWFKTTLKHSDRKLPEEMLTESEVQNMIRAAQTPRDSAFIAMLYETGCRIGEIMELKIRNLSPSEPGMQVMLSEGKTGARRIRIIASVPYITKWLNEHPASGRRDAPLWQCRTGEAMGYKTVTKLLSQLKRKCGIDKRVHPHLFRHSRATQLAKHLTEAQMKQYLGWAQASKMAAVYVHLSGRDVDNAIMKMNGLEPENDSEAKAVLKPRECSRCGQSNASTFDYCGRCGMPLDEKAAAEMLREDLARKEADSKLDRLVRDPEFREFLLSKLGSL